MSTSSIGLATVRQLSACSEGGLADEVEMLQNIYMPEELQINTLDSGVVEVCIHITPSTGGDMAKKYLYLDLCLTLGTKYPKEAAVVSLRSSRGLSDAGLRHISSSLEEKAAELQGCLMVFELVDYAKDCLTEQNLPSDHCPICLLNFQEEEECTRTDCYHYFHVSCLAGYIQFLKAEESEEQSQGSSSPPLTCPVCREVLVAESSCLAAVSQATPPLGCYVVETEVVRIAPDIRAWQKEMAILLEHQRQKGGVIDLSAKDEVIDETWVRPRQTPSETSTISSPSSGEKGKGEQVMDEDTNMFTASRSEKKAVGPSDTREKRKGTDKPTHGRRLSDECESRSRRKENRVGSSPGERWKERKRHYGNPQTPSSGGERRSGGRKVEFVANEGRDEDSDQAVSGKGSSGHISTTVKCSGAQQSSRRREKSKRKVAEEVRDEATSSHSSEATLQTDLKHMQLSIQITRGQCNVEEETSASRNRIKLRNEDEFKMAQTRARSPRREACHDREHHLPKNETKTNAGLTDS